MKVGELRKILEKHSKAELIKVAVELYKRIPKAKKEEYDIDEMVQQPNKTKPTKKIKTTTLAEIKIEIRTFIEHVRAAYYYDSNRIVPKKERSTWRFKVKRYYKELNNWNRTDRDIPVQAALLSELYSLLAEACHYAHFTTFDPFRSIGVEQTTFYETVLRFLYEAESDGDFIKKGIALSFKPSDGNTLKSSLLRIFVNALPNEEAKNLTIVRTKYLLQEKAFIPKRRNTLSSFSDYEAQERNNRLTELTFRLYASMEQYETALAFYQQHYQQHREEVKLYILISFLFELRQAGHIVEQIELAQKNGIEPRQNLLKLYEGIKKSGKLPKYMY